MSVGAAEERRTMCLVHDRRWASTYQYILTQMHRNVGLARKDGRLFTNHVCICDKPMPDLKLYYPAETHRFHFRMTVTAIKKWPQECELIMQPIIKQMEKYEEGEMFHSLMKFVFYFDAVDNHLDHRLRPGYRLPGDTSGDNASSGTASLVTPSTGNRSTTASSSAGSQSLSVGSTVGGASSPRAGPSSLGGNTTPMETSTTTPPAPALVPPKPAVLKNVKPEEWSEDCYFHGRKKKFRFQCIVNYLHKNTRLQTNMNIPFSMAVCLCKEEFEMKDFYASVADLVRECKTMREKMNRIAGDSRSTFIPVIQLLDDYINRKIITNGFIKVVYHFNKVFRGDFQTYVDLHELVKKSRFNR